MRSAATDIISIVRKSSYSAVPLALAAGAAFALTSSLNSYFQKTHLIRPLQIDVSSVSWISTVKIGVDVAAKAAFTRETPATEIMAEVAKPAVIRTESTAVPRFSRKGVGVKRKVVAAQRKVTPVTKTQKASATPTAEVPESRATIKEASRADLKSMQSAFFMLRKQYVAALDEPVVNTQQIVAKVSTQRESRPAQKAAHGARQIPAVPETESPTSKKESPAEVTALIPESNRVTRTQAEPIDISIGSAVKMAELNSNEAQMAPSSPRTEEFSSSPVTHSGAGPLGARLVEPKRERSELKSESRESNPQVQTTEDLSILSQAEQEWEATRMTALALAHGYPAVVNTHDGANDTQDHDVRSHSKGEYSELNTQIQKETNQTAEKTATGIVTIQSRRTHATRNLTVRRSVRSGDGTAAAVVVAEAPKGHPVPQREDRSAEVVAPEPNLSASRVEGDAGRDAIHASRSVPTRAWMPPVAYEAFLVDRLTVGSTVDTLSVEGMESSNQARWIHVRAEDHWPTLGYVRGVRQESIPVISENTAKMLGAVAGVRVEERAGIVFGKVAEGWSVEFSGRSEPIIYLDSSLQRVQEDNDSVERHFILLNASPGGHLLYATNRLEQYSGAIATPVRPGKATFVDMSTPTTLTLRGEVMDASTVYADGVPGVHVRVLGHHGAGSISDSLGRVEVDDIVTFDPHPVYVEAVDQDGIKHRYQFRHDQLDGASLFHFSHEQVLKWKSAVKDGISRQSGIVIAAVPALSKAPDTSGAPLYPVITPIDESTLTPQAHTLRRDGTVMLRGAIDASAPRFLGVQIPDGFNLLEVRDGGRLIWSELVRSSPGVINVVSP